MNIMGSVVTFYSYKGGVGRSFAVANVAIILAQWGYRVLVVDWDIEAPGLHHFFSGLTEQLPAGVLDFLASAERGMPGRWNDYASPVTIPDAPEGLFLMPAAAGGGADYTSRVQALDWEALYRDHDFGAQLEALRSEWVDHFDLVLVDSRTGLTDFSAIITAQLPDVLAFLFTANNQSLQGSCDIAQRAMEARRKIPVDRPALVPLPVPARFEQREEYDRAQSWRLRFANDLTPFFNIWVPTTVDKPRLVDLLTIPYVPRWTFGEDLCALLEPPGTTGTRTPGQAASFALETLAAVLANGFSQIDLLVSSRDEYVHTARASAANRRLPHDRPIKVFISAGTDEVGRRLVAAIREAMRKRGLEAFYAPDDLFPGDKYHVEITSALERSDALVTIITGHDFKIQETQALRFLRQSLRTDLRKPIIPVLVSGVGDDLLQGSRFGDLQYVVIDPTAKPLESQFEPVFQRLLTLQRQPTSL
jgi:cellulose biosynthesis protein BcsQ